jgi:hypothetical protein
MYLDFAHSLAIEVHDEKAAEDRRIPSVDVNSVGRVYGPLRADAKLQGGSEPREMVIKFDLGR